MSRVVLKGPERRSSLPKKERNSVLVRSSPIRTLPVCFDGAGQKVDHFYKFVIIIIIISLKQTQLSN